MAQRSGGVTATASSIEGAKAHGTVQAWALGLKDALEQAFVYTAQWLAEAPSAEVGIHTDFAGGQPQTIPLDALAKARANLDISREAFLDGLVRFDVLAPGFDAEADAERLALEAAGLQPETAAAA